MSEFVVCDNSLVDVRKLCGVVWCVYRQHIALLDSRGSHRTNHVVIIALH